MFEYVIRIKCLFNDTDRIYMIQDSDISRAIAQAFIKYHKEIGFTFGNNYSFKVENLKSGIEVEDDCI